MYATSTPQDQTLVPSVSIENLLQRRAAFLDRIERARALLIEALEVGACFGDLEGAISSQSRYKPEILERDGVERARKLVDALAWNSLMKQSGLMTFMDQAARSAWYEKISQRSTPAFEKGTIELTFDHLYAARGEMFERGVIGCFQSLSWDFKTNLPARFGKRIIVTNFCRDWKWSYMNSGACGQLDDLIRVFSLLDGKPEPDYRNGVFYWLAAHAKESPRNRCATGEYLAVKWFKNGNAHVEFLRPDLVDKLNEIIAKHYPNALPARV